LVNTKGMTNLVWVWSVKDVNPGQLTSYYPGSSYVDVVALDSWTHLFPTMADYRAIQDIAGAKPIALAEVGQLPSPAQLAAQPDWSYFSLWVDRLTANNSVSEIRSIYGDPRVLHQGDIHIARGGRTDASARSAPSASEGDSKQVAGPPAVGPASRAASKSQASDATSTITGLDGKCVDVDGANRANGTQIQLYHCDDTDAQLWTAASDGTLRALGKCLTVRGGATVNGTRVHLWDCDGTGAQRWSLSSGQLVNSQSGRCLDVTDWNSADWTPLQIWDCTGESNQRWSIANAVGGAPPLPGPASVGNPQPSGGTAMSAPYAYLGWGNPPDPRTIMAATGIKWFTMAFILTNGYCNPMWDGSRPLTGGNDQTTINNIRGAGGDVVVSFGGASGPWLEQSCGSAGELAAAYQKVINTYGLRGIDIDIEGTVYNNPTLQQRTVDALKTVKANNHGITVYVTFPSGPNGPDSGMINRAHGSGLTVDGWTIMPFDFGGNGQDMGKLTVTAAEGLKNTLKAGYGYTDDQAYRHAGISSMNGVTDVGEIITQGDFQTMLAYAQQHHLARFTFWSANRDRPCGARSAADSCSGVSQSPWDFTRLVARYRG
jgi:hypothetical protein